MANDISRWSPRKRDRLSPAADCATSLGRTKPAGPDQNHLAEDAMPDTRPFDPALFGDAAIDPDTAKLNAQMIELLTGEPEWWIVGAEAYRAARRRGEGPFPAPVMSSRARTTTITGRDGNEILLRVIAPAQPRGIYLHLHGGGWVL